MNKCGANMNPEKLKKLEEITENKPIRLRESYWTNNYSEFHQEISNYINLDLPFIQKVWHWVNDYPNEFKCICGKKTTFNRNWKDGYKLYCSAKCVQAQESTKEKRKKTNTFKYGVDNIAKLVDIKEKMEKTNLEKYGTKSSFQNLDVRQKWKDNMVNKYGVDHYFKTDEFKIKAKQYYLTKYGVEHQLNVEEIKEKIKNTCFIRYGYTTYLNTEHSRGCIKKYNRSSYEDEICNWLSELNIEYIKSDRSILNPLMLDIYLPSINLAIEFNGLYWHSELFKDKDYHLNKTRNCKLKNIQLIHIWEDDWKNRKEVLKSIISNKLNLIKEKVWARKCEIKSVNNKDTSNFLNTNHLQGYTRFSDSIGLYYNNELVSLMCFGWRSTNGKREYELIRFCNKIGTNIIGAASKLFKYFLNSHLEVDNIVSYADRSVFDGGLYEKLGFEWIRHSGVNYWWVVNGIRKHRFNYNKKKLVSLGYDQSKTEVEIMHEMGNYRIFGCGQDRYVYKR